MKIYFIYAIFQNLKEAKSIGSKLVQNKLAACTNIIPEIYSTYMWKNKTVVDKECSMIAKTTKSNVKEAIKFIVKRHSYDCPAVTAFPIKHAHKDFEKWVLQETKRKL